VVPARLAPCAFRAIATALNDRGVRTARGGAWHDSTVRNLRTPWSTHAEARLRSALKAIPAVDYRIWIRIGMALHHLEWDRSDGTSIGFDIWDEWSATCPEKYARGATERVWQGLSRDSGPMVTDGTIFHMAFERGWTGDDMRSAKADANEALGGYWRRSRTDTHFPNAAGR
jgi:hypothetical protein